MGIPENLRRFTDALPQNVRLIAVSKYQSLEAIREAYDAGQRLFGENKALECAQKQAELPNDIEWHFIGHLQTNKVKYIAPFVRLIHSVDSLKLLREINKEAAKNQRVVDCLMQFHIAREETKFGLTEAEARELLQEARREELQHVRICGVMGMASLSEDEALVCDEFRTLRRYFEVLKQEYFNGQDHFCEISMGMTQDFRLAIEEGATLIRIGTAIFGERN